MDASSDDSDFRDTPARTSRITSARHNRAEILLACIKCSYKTTVKSNLKRHEKTHDDARGFVAQKIYCPELGCNQGVATVAKLREHLSTSHSRTIETEQLLFQNSEEFQSWMTDLQEKSLVKFVKMKSRSGRAAYQCNRSGAYKPQGTGKRMQKKNGTIKCGRTCPCGLELQMDTSGIKYLKKDPTNESAEDQDVPLSDDSDDEDELIIDTTDFLELRQEEVRAHTVDLSRNVPEDIKEDLRRQFEELLAKSEDTGTLKIIGDCLKTASLKIQMQGEFRPTFQETARREPGNKNIEKQKRFQKPRPRKQVSATVTSSDVEVMSQIIPPVFHQDSQ
ncbi:unnamed protein product [Allacma fusca]|uniref:C2H2-type domain-containing protein n=1 Tax=Allacma fusca TaxID=39272 RepID=A0A8J2JWH9_9HEXA|nr:unnamed protein product [Allacma fusca]